MEKESGVFYRSIVEGITMLPEAHQLAAFKAYAAYVLDDEEYDGDDQYVAAMLCMVKPSIDKANNRYKAAVENGKKGGRPRKIENQNKTRIETRTKPESKPEQNRNETRTETRTKPNRNLNVDVDVDVDVDVNNISSSDNKLSSEDCRFAKTQKPTPHQLIIENLNELSGRHFAWKGEKGKKNREYINARMKEGYSIEDFLEVNRKKVDEWKDDPQWEQYIRPETLYCRKHFESYLNAPEKRGGFF